jgi:3-hydroxyisobutyrate dehydrogenase
MTTNAAIDALRVGLVGYGEVGGILGAALAAQGVARVTAFDIKVGDPAWREPAARRAARVGVTLAASARDAVDDAGLVICAVTAAQTRAAAESIASALRPGAFVLDVDSASPQTRSQCARLIDDAGGRYVEAAVMTSVPPSGIRVPMLLGGPHAEAVLPLLARLGFGASPGAPEYGVVSAIKLSRSVFIKGLEALAIEALLTARRYGVEREVLASLAETFPGIDWERQASWFWRRVVQHGRRRAEEMREAAVTIEDAGVEPRMASAIADVQAWVAALHADGAFDRDPAQAGWRELADAVPREPGGRDEG